MLPSLHSDYDFYRDYQGLTHVEGMKIIDFLDRQSMDWDSGILGNLLSQVFERYLTGYDASELADEIVIAAREVLKE